MGKIYDFAIIGSGTSGGTFAHYLTQAGASCLLIEAGEHYTAKNFPDNELDSSVKLFWSGGMDMSTDARLVFLRGKCLGGGSIVNQCLLDRFSEDVFVEWKEISGVDFSLEEMLTHYEQVESKLSLQTITEKNRNRNATLYVDAFEKLGYRWAPLRRGQSNCTPEKGNDCIVCLGGCPRDSKQSIPVAFLPKALEKGLETLCEFEVDRISAHKEKVTIYGKEDKEIYAKNCILAGGALGTTKLLLKSGFKKKLPALGKNFYCHPQVMNLAFFDSPVDSHKGSFQAVKSDDPGFRAKNFKLENVFAAPAQISVLYPELGRKHQQFMKKYRYMACIEVAIRDRHPGTIAIDRHGELKIRKIIHKKDQKSVQQGRKVVSEIFQAVGAQEIFHSNFKFGLHLMGGCAIGKDSKHSIVNKNFQVHGHPNLFIADSSIFPSAPGINPALSIMALSHKACQKILQ